MAREASRAATSASQGRADGAWPDGRAPSRAALRPGAGAAQAPHAHRPRSAPRRAVRPCGARAIPWSSSPAFTFADLPPRCARCKAKLRAQDRLDRIAADIAAEGWTVEVCDYGEDHETPGILGQVVGVCVPARKAVKIKTHDARTEQLAACPVPNPRAGADLLLYARHSCSFASYTCSWSGLLAG